MLRPGGGRRGVERDEAWDLVCAERNKTYVRIWALTKSLLE